MTEKRIALVTGGNRGIGFEACRQLGRRGLRVILTSRDEAEGRKAVAQLQREGLDILYHQLDISSSDNVAVCVREIRQQGGVNVLVNNAGVYLTTPILQVSEADFMQSLQVNLLGAWRMCQAFMPDMLDRGYG